MSHPVIIAAQRTPVGRFMGGLSRVPSPKLGSLVIEQVLSDVPAAKDRIDEAIFGCVLQAGLGQNPARQAGLGAGLPETLNAQTINKVCGSGLQAVMSAAQSIKAGDNTVVLAGGFENMSLAPHYAYLRGGAKFGPVQFNDHMQSDGLTCAFEKWGMTNAAEHVSNMHDITREQMDAYSARSHQLADKAWNEGWFDAESIALTGEQLGNRKKPGPEGGISRDEGIRGDSTAESLSQLRTIPAHEFITAGNASQISDGAAAVLVCAADAAGDLGAQPLAKIIDYYTSGVAPKDIFHAPALGMQALLDRNDLKVDDIDLFELNEAFASQVLANQKVVGIPDDKLNICGGGVAIGHPIGASGARVLVTLVHQLRRVGGQRGIASLCLGGGNSVNMLIECA